jgi:hypothetical protein
VSVSFFIFTDPEKASTSMFYAIFQTGVAILRVFYQTIFNTGVTRVCAGGDLITF